MPRSYRAATNLVVLTSKPRRTRGSDRAWQTCDPGASGLPQVTSQIGGSLCQQFPGPPASFCDRGVLRGPRPLVAGLSWSCGHCPVRQAPIRLGTGSAVGRGRAGQQVALFDDQGRRCSTTRGGVVAARGGLWMFTTCPGCLVPQGDQGVPGRHVGARRSRPGPWGWPRSAGREVVAWREDTRAVTAATWAWLITANPDVKGRSFREYQTKGVSWSQMRVGFGRVNLPYS